MNDTLYGFLLSLPKASLINVMMEALSNMQQWNGRSETRCIMMAIGAKEIEEDKWQWNPKKARKFVKENGFI